MVADTALHILEQVRDLNEEVRKHGDALTLAEARLLHDRLKTIEAWCLGMRKILVVDSKLTM